MARDGRVLTPKLVAACAGAGIALAVVIAWWQATRPPRLIVAPGLAAPPSSIIVDEQRRIVGRFTTARPRAVRFDWIEGNGPWHQTKPVPAGIPVVPLAEVPSWVVRCPALGGPSFPGKEPPAGASMGR